MAEDDDDDDDDDELPCVDHDPLNEGAVLKVGKNRRVLKPSWAFVETKIKGFYFSCY